VLIPARDEAAMIGACLSSIGGGCSADFEVLVLDDGSCDDTAAIAAAHGARVITGAALPSGWLGKPHACAQLAAAASGEVLVFLDADVRLAPGAIDAAVGLLASSGLDLVSPHPRQVAVTASERLVQPLLQWSILPFLPLRLAERSPRPSLAAANGQFLVVRRAAYDRAGGHVHDAVLDDLALLRAIKRSGGRGALVDGTDLASCRMYAGWPELRDGYAKSLWAAFGSPPGSVAVLSSLALAYLLPPLAALRGSRIGAIGYGAAVAGRVITARRTGGRVLDAPAHPVSVAMLIALTVRSHVQHRRGTLRWKGRPVR
jgi:glycosyltransferase involved in cell wall biosynthesis